MTESPKVLSGFCSWSEFLDQKIAVCINTEGYRPYAYRGSNQTVYSLYQVIDLPLENKTFKKAQKTKTKRKCRTIEEAVGITIPAYLSVIVPIIQRLKKKHFKVLVHLVQYADATEMGALLAEAADVKVITDKTTFQLLPPINYAMQYADYDAVFVVSQCAGLGLPVGTWVAPTKFLIFDVPNQVVYTKPIRDVSQHELLLSEKVPAVVHGAVLVANGQWDELETQGPMLIDEQDTPVLQFVQKSYKSSHKWEAAVRVSAHATRIHNSKHVLYLALLQDVSSLVSSSVLSAFIKTLDEQYHVLESMIHRLHSKEGIHNTIPTEIQAVRKANRINSHARNLILVIIVLVIIALLVLPLLNF